MLGSLQEQNALSGRPSTPATERLSVVAAADCARFSLRLSPQACEQAGRLFGCLLPSQIGGLSVKGERMAACLGPDEWLLLAPATEGVAIAARFATELGETHSLVDVSHREVGIEVRGPAANLALSAGCALNLAAMPAQRSTRTIFDKAQVVLLKYASDHYRIEVWQSFADHVWSLLQMSARDIALDL